MANEDGLVYKITTGEAWSAACERGSFSGSADDVRDGYIHLSAPDQLAATAAKYFSGVAGLVLVGIDAAQLGAALKWEPSRGGALFPHYYGAMPVEVARFVRPMRLDEAGVPCVAELLEP